MYHGISYVMLPVNLTTIVVFFFFKQKTAYEMRISDWSSDVCSSDLAPATASPLATDMASAPAVLAEADSPAAGTVTELFTTRPMQQPRPWPRAILPGLPAQDAFTVGYGGMAQEQHPFHPFEPRVELQPAPAEDRKSTRLNSSH